MIPTNVILDEISNLLAADPATLAPVALACHVHLMKAPFTPGPTTAFSALNEATFAGSTAKDAGVGPQQEFRDPITGLRIVQLLEPAGGWHWQCTADPTPAEVIYGFIVTDNTDAVTYGSALLSAPVTIAAAGQAVDLPWIRFTFAANSPF